MVITDSLAAQLVKNPPAMQETLVQFLGQEDRDRLPTPVFLGFPSVVQSLKNLPAMQETQVRFLSGKDPPEKETVTHSLPGESHEQRSLAGYSPWGRKSRTRLSD